MSSAFKIYALFIGSALLMFGGGLQGLLLSVRGAQEGFSLLALGLIGTGWSVGFVAGSIMVPMLVQRVGQEGLKAQARQTLQEQIVHRQSVTAHHGVDFIDGLLPALFGGLFGG